MNLLLKLEYIALLIFSIVLFATLDYPWWLYLILFLAPDVGMMGYLVNPKIGAITYNLTHVLFVGIGVYGIGIFLNLPVAQLIGVIIVGHSSFDRILGFGLKYSDSFKHTHLGNL